MLDDLVYVPALVGKGRLWVILLMLGANVRIYIGNDEIFAHLCEIGRLKCWGKCWGQCGCVRAFLANFLFMVKVLGVFPPVNAKARLLVSGGYKHSRYSVACWVLGAKKASFYTRLLCSFQILIL